MSKTSKSVWLYYKAVSLLIAVVAWGAWAMPILISADDNFMVIGGILITVAILPLLVILIIKTIQSIFELADEPVDDE